MTINRISYKKFTFGYTFEDDKQVISMIFINYFFIVMFSFILLMVYIQETIIPVFYKYHIILFLLCLNLLFFRLKKPFIPKVTLLLGLPFTLLIAAPLFHVIETDYYFWSPYIPAGLSLIPHFILKPYKEAILKISILLLYLLLTILIDDFLFLFDDGNEIIRQYILSNKFYYNFTPFIIFFFVNVTIGLAFNQNALYEMKVKAQSAALEVNNKQLSTQQKILQEKNSEVDQTIRRLYETQNELIQSEKLAALGTLTSGLAHEINNPLNYISGSIAEMERILEERKVAQSKLEDGKQDSYFDEMEQLLGFSKEGLRRSTEIVKRLGSLKSRSTQNTSVYDLNEMIESVLITVREKIPDQIQLTSKIEKNMLLYCNRGEMKRLIRNIVDNAIDAIQKTEIKTGKISISGKRKETSESIQYILEIANNGPVIPEEEMKKLFDPFYTTKTLSEGSGLGLSEAYNIIQRHKGQIKVENRNKFVVFTISLPEST